MSVIDLLTQPRIRQYKAGDQFPAQLKVGFDVLGKLDGNWVWVVEENGLICGVLVAAPLHGLAMIYRLALMPRTPLSRLTALLRRFLADLRAQGVPGYVTWIDPEVKIQAKLKRVIERAGGKQVGNPHIVMASPLPKENV